MGATLSQSAEAGFSDRGAVGLKVALSVGLDGAYLSHDLGAEQAKAHVRVMVHGGTASGGSVRIAGGADEQGLGVWWVDWDAEARVVRLEHGDGLLAEAALDGLAWQCVEVMVDAGQGEALLWVNGLERDGASGATLAGTRRVWLGAVFKEKDVAGQMYLDEWVVDEGFIGPVVVRPSGEHADDPARWLVIYNRSVEASAAWAEDYRQRRGVPYANLLGLALSSDEVIDGQGYAELVGAVNDYLEATGLSEQVLGVIAGYRVPGYVDFFGDASLKRAVADLLHSASDGPEVIEGLGADALPSERLDGDALGGLRLTARIDGPTLEDAMALSERAQVFEASGLGGWEQARLFVDTTVDREPALEVEPLDAWARSVDRMRTRLAMMPQEVGEPVEQVSGDAFYLGFGPVDVPTDFFAGDAGPRVLFGQWEVLEGTGTSVRDAEGDTWLERALGAGYAGVVSSSKAYSPSAVPYARPLMEALRRGWTLGEAWMLALPLLREGLFLTGDPLLRVGFVRAGWDVYGPGERLETMDLERPSVALAAGDGVVALEDALEPGEDGPGVYVAHRVNEQGYSDRVMRVVRLQRHEGQVHRAMLEPVWPDVERWPATVRGGAVWLRVAWERMVGQTGVRRVELMGEVDGADEAVLGERAIGADVDRRKRVIELEAELPAEQGRYRWRLVGDGGMSWFSPWSAMVRAGQDEASLTLVQ